MNEPPASVPPPTAAPAEEESDADLRMLELRHRMKNILAIIQSLVNQTLRSGRTIEEARRALDRRLAAMGNAVDMLLETTWSAAQLRDLMERCLTAGDGRVTLEGPDVEIGPDAAMSLSLVLHELESNAIKYGALSKDEGRVEVRWTVEQKDGTECLALSWRERDGPTVTPPSREGFGSRMISKVIGRQLGGSADTEFAPDGLKWRLSASMAALAH
jgi:two-component sensor histidine kinase